MTDPEVRSYAWNWFALHAGQRLQLVLRDLEAEWVSGGTNSRIALVARAHEARRSSLDSYRFVIQGLQLSIAAVFLGAFLYTLAS